MASQNMGVCVEGHPAEESSSEPATESEQKVLKLSSKVLKTNPIIISNLASQLSNLK